MIVFDIRNESDITKHNNKPNKHNKQNKHNIHNKQKAVQIGDFFYRKEIGIVLETKVERRKKRVRRKKLNDKEKKSNKKNVNKLGNR